jgi:hypothetical protein
MSRQRRTMSTGRVHGVEANREREPGRGIEDVDRGTEARIAAGHVLVDDQRPSLLGQHLADGAGLSVQAHVLALQDFLPLPTLVA